MSSECSAGNIPPGYKQTEVGVIPEDWNVDTIGELCSCFSGGTPSTSNPSYYGGNIAWITSGDLNDVRIKEVQGRITDEGLVNSTAKIVKEGTLLLALYGATAGVSAVTEIKAAINQAVLAIITKKLDTEYLFQYLRLRKDSYIKIFAQGGQPNFSGEIVKSFIIPFPPTFYEQEAIAEALSDTDAFIESLEQLIAKKRQIKQGTMQELLTGKRRLPGFNGEWIGCSLRDCLLADPDYGINAPGVPDSGSLPTYLRITDINDDGRFMQGNKVAVNHPLAMNYLLGRNEIVFARTGASVGKTYLYNIKDCELVFAGFLIRAKINCEKLCPEFLAAFTKTSQYWDWVHMMSMRSGQPGINGNEFAALYLYLPPTLEEQNAIATILSYMDSEITALEEKLAKARHIKQGMMQELLTGKIRLI